MVKVKFNDLNENAQEYLYSQNPSEFWPYALQSKYSKIRNVAYQCKNIQTEILEQEFNEEIENADINTRLISTIYNSPNFKKDDEKRRKIVETSNDSLTLMVIEDKKTSSELLNEILVNEVKGLQNTEIIEKIFANSNFKMTEETEITIRKITGEHILYMIEYHNVSSKTLNMILSRALEDDDSSIIDSMQQSHPYLEIDEENLENLAKSSQSQGRCYAASAKNASTEFLSKLFITEIMKNNKRNVEETICANPNFKMNMEILNLLVKSQFKYERLIAASDDMTPQSILEEMYIKEKDEEVLNQIEINLLRKTQKNTSTLTAVQKRKILKLLIDVRLDKKKTLNYYLNQIIQIIEQK